jgi:hypothetical protein
MPIFRGRISANRNAIAPKEHDIWGIAESKLKEAQASIAAMKGARTRDEYRDAWGRFVDSLQEAWVSFEYEGVNKVPKFRKWVTPIYRERKKDPLLLYLYQARHQSQHGQVPLAWSEANVKIAPNWSGHIKRLEVFKDGTHIFDAYPQDGKSEPTLEYSPGDPLLPTVENKKHNQKFDPPTEHLGRPLVSRDPVDAAELAFNYYQSLIREARGALLQSET